jgi:hypothetical protein
MPGSLRNGLVFAGLGEHPGTTWYEDQSGLGNHGTLTNMDPATDWVWSEELGRWTLSLASDDDHINAPAGFASFNGLTMHIGVRIANDLAVRRRVFILDRNTNSSWEHGIQFDSAMRWEFGVSANGGALGSVTLADTTPSARRSITGVWDGAVCCLYRDGMLGAEAARAIAFRPTARIQIGRLSQYGVAGFTAHDALIWNRALTPPEIQWLASPTNHLRVPWRRTVWPVSTAATIEATLSESLTAGDFAVAALSALASTSEGVSLGDSQTATATGRPSVSDGAAIGDATEAAATLRPTEADGATLGDTQAAEATLRRSLVDGVLAGEQWAVRFTRAATIADGSLLGDSFAALVLSTIQAALSEGTQAGSAFAAALLAYGAITEGIRTSDAYAAMVAAVASMADSATLGDVFSIVRAIAGAVLEGALAGDAFAAVLAHYVRGPYLFAAAQVHSAGLVAAHVHAAGPTAAQVHSAGLVAGMTA